MYQPLLFSTDLQFPTSFRIQTQQEYSVITNRALHHRSYISDELSLRARERDAGTWLPVPQPGTSTHYKQGMALRNAWMLDLAWLILLFTGRRLHSFKMV